MIPRPPRLLLAALFALSACDRNGGVDPNAAAEALAPAAKSPTAAKPTPGAPAEDATKAERAAFARGFAAGQKAAKAGPPTDRAGCEEAKKAAPAEVPERSVIDVGSAPARGPGDAPITIALFSDFQCPYCARVEPTLRALEAELPGKLRIVWKNQPLPFHDRARPAAAAALAAAEQGRFWEMHERIFGKQRALDDATLEKHAAELGLDVARFKETMASEATRAALDADVAQAKALGVRGTPTLFINGRRVVGAQPKESLRAVIDEELGRAQR